jgi:methyl-accepting chemotaxis protein
MFKKSLPMRLAALVSMSLAIVFILSGTFISIAVGSFFSKGVNEELTLLTSSVKKSIEIYNDQLETSAVNLSGVFSQAFQGDFSVDNDRTVDIVGQKVPSLLSNDLDIVGNYSQVDQFAEVTGGNATIFVRRGDDFVRVVTSVIKQDGNRAVGTLLSHNSPAYEKNLEGQPFTGKVELFGNRFITNYTPIKDKAGNVIGIRYIGISFNESLENLKNGLVSLKIGESGYLSIVNAGKDDKRGSFEVYPNDKQAKTFPDDVFDKMMSTEKGNLSYTYPNSDKNLLAIYEHIPELDWLLIASVPEEQVYAPKYWVRNMLMVLTLVLIVVVVLVLSIMSNRMLGTPLNEIVAHIQAIAKGDYSNEIKITRSDEVGKLQVALQQMQQMVKGTISKITSTSLDLASAAAQLSASSAQVAKGSEEQTQAATSMASTIEELTVSIDRLSENASEAKALSQSSNENSIHGASVIQQASAEMHKISTTVKNASNEISELGQLSGQISSIIKVIQEIADQTNLLALNAAIEAARAGDQGRGFAVVADEVRGLAARTSSSAQEITSTIGQIQSGTRKSVDTMTAGVNQVNHGADLSSQAGRAIEDIQSGSLRVLEVFTEISDMLREQALASNDVAKNVDNIAQMTERNTEAVSEVADAAESLQAMADQLKSLVSHFKIGNN